MITGLAEQINLLFPDAAIDASIHYLNQQKNRKKKHYITGMMINKVS